MAKYRINDQCIGCRACTRVAGDLFKMEDQRAVLIKQPQTPEETERAEGARGVCPTAAIERTAASPILGSSKVRETLEAHPELKDVLLSLSPKFEKLQRPAMWQTVARFATFSDAAKMTGLSLCEILHALNTRIGTEAALSEAFPECIGAHEEETGDGPARKERLLQVDDLESLEEALVALETLPSDEGLILRSSLPLEPLVRSLEASQTPHQIDRAADGVHMLTIGPKEAKDSVLDVRRMSEDPFDLIVGRAYDMKTGESFTLVQRFKPMPLIIMLSSMGFDHQILSEVPGEVKILFEKKEEEQTADAPSTDLPSLTIQSATPVAYPILMRLLQSKPLRGKMRIKELKVWEETEKHLGWIANGRADISFSSLITASKFKGRAVKMPAVFVWDNFVLLSRDPAVKGFDDLVGRELSLPLFEDAPPAKITTHLIHSAGLDRSDFHYRFGEPFGRPKELLRDLVTGKAETVLLREPEASFAIAALKRQNQAYSEIRYADLWQKANAEGSELPNAGVMVKASLYEDHPELMALFHAELVKAIEWVSAHPREAAELAYDLMGRSVDDVSFFIERASFRYVDGKALEDVVRTFYGTLNDSGIQSVRIDNELMDLFTL